MRVLPNLLLTVALAVTAGCVDPPDEPQDPTESAKEHVPIMVDYNGSLGRQICLPGAGMACGRVVREDNVNTEYAVEGSANLTVVDGVAYWNSTQVATDDLRVRIMAERTACRNCYETAAAKIGASPLAFSVSVVMTEPLDGLEIWVDVPPDQVSPAVYSVHEPEAFHVIARLSG